MKGRLCNKPELDLGHSLAYVIVASGFQVLHLILARSLEGRQGGSLLPGEGLESQVLVGLELEVRLLPSLDRGFPASEMLRHSLSVQVRARALGEGRLDVPQVSRGWPPTANKFRKYQFYTVITNAVSEEC